MGGLALAGNENGNGGDPLCLEFDEARAYTKSCMRQTASVSAQRKDGQNNDVVDETEMVILSQF